MEEVFGEYILNMSRENLRIAVIKGEIKLDDVQLDGDLVGSHFFGPVGLTTGSFGVLSCSAKSIRISVPWKQLEKVPTKFEVEGVHLVCVPLTPTTANQMYGAGTTQDPRCSLKTRAKRLSLARFERNFWNGQIPGEGPPLKRVKRAVKEVEREIRRSNKNGTQNTKSNKKRASSSMSSTSMSSSQTSIHSDMSIPSSFGAMEEALDSLVNSIQLGKHDSATTAKKYENKDDDNFDFNPLENNDLPNLPRDWKVKLREKVLRNLEASMKRIHIRCEVPQCEYSESKQEDDMNDRSFSFGFTIESLVIRTASEKWEVGSHDTADLVDASVALSTKDHIGPNEYIVNNNKIGYFSKLLG
jgi:N-terminal region of Chorein or VPS13/Vacuolar sorting-associated protein 13, N-terminal